MQPNDDLVLHLCQRKHWEKAKAEGEYRAASLESEGFIHCSRRDQILGVVNRFYAQVPDLVLLWIDPERVRAEIRWEPADGGVFPHVYGPINLDAVLVVRDFHSDPDGVYREIPSP